MTHKKDNSIISFLDYQKKKLKKQQIKKTASSDADNSDRSAQIFYMSNYLKTKKIPDLKALKKEQDKTFFPETKKEAEKSNIIILDQYRKEKHQKRIWKKQIQFYTKEALSVSGMAFLFLFTFNLAVSLQSQSPAKDFKTAHQIETEPNNQELAEKNQRGIANLSKKNKIQSLSYKKQIQKMKQLKRENVILGKKSSSSNYTGF